MQPQASKRTAVVAWVFFALAALSFLSSMGTAYLGNRTGISEIIVDRAGNVALIAGNQLETIIENGDNRTWEIPETLSRNSIAVSDGLDGYIIAAASSRDIGRFTMTGHPLWTCTLPEEAGSISDIALSAGRVFVGTGYGIWVVSINGTIEGRLELADFGFDSQGQPVIMSVTPQDELAVADLDSKSILIYNKENVLGQIFWLDQAAVKGLAPEAILALTKEVIIIAGKIADYPVLVKYDAANGSAILLGLPEEVWKGFVRLRSTPEGFVICDIDRGLLWSYGSNGIFKRPYQKEFSGLNSVDREFWKSLCRILIWVAAFTAAWALFGFLAAWILRRKALSYPGLWALFAPPIGLSVLSSTEKEEFPKKIAGTLICALLGLLIFLAGCNVLWHKDLAEVSDSVAWTWHQTSAVLRKMQPAPKSIYNTYLADLSVYTSGPSPEERYLLAVWYLANNKSQKQIIDAAISELSLAAAESGRSFYELYEAALANKSWPDKPDNAIPAIGSASSNRNPWFSGGEGEIHLVPVGPLDSNLLRRLQNELNGRINRVCVIMEPVKLDSSNTNVTNGRFLSADFLKTYIADQAIWTFAIVDSQLDSSALSEIAPENRVSILSLEAISQDTPPSSEQRINRIMRQVLEHLSAAANFAWSPDDHADCRSYRSKTIAQLDSAVSQPDTVCRQRVETALDLWAYLSSGDPQALEKVWAERDISSGSNLAILVRDAAIKLWSGQKAQALEILTKADGLDPSFSLLDELLAAAKTRLTGEFAEPVYDPENRQWAGAFMINAADGLRSLFPEESVYFGERARRLEWTAWQADRVIGIACMEAGAYRQALTHLSKAVQDCVFDEQTFAYYAMASIAAGESVQGRKTLESLSASTNNVQASGAWFALGLLEMHSDDMYRAATAFRKAARLLPEWPLPYEMLARVWDSLGLKKQADASRERFQKMGGDVFIDFDLCQKVTDTENAVAEFEESKTAE